jgi:3-oxoacyl-[acyl-carrier-protein] synthase I
MHATLSESVAITAASFVSCIGSSLPEIRNAVKASANGLTRNHQWTQKIPAPVGAIADSWIEQAISASSLNSSLTRLQVVTCRLIDELMTSSSLTSRYRPRDIGLAISTTSAGLETWFGLLAKQDKHWSSENPRVLFTGQDHSGTLADIILSKFPIRGPDITFSTACSGGALAIARGADMIRRGEVNACIVGGIDVLTSITMHGFNALQVMDYESCRPFHPLRNGMNLGEGGAFLVLEKAPKDHPMGFLAGYGTNTDFHHMTQPSPSGLPMALCMQRALDHAKWSADMVTYVNAHGTGTKANDAAETCAIESAFGHQVFFNSTKAMHGHMLAGAGAFEAVMTLDALRQNQYFVDPRLPGTPPLPNCLGSMGHALTNSFGFGGHNVTLALKVTKESLHD